MKIKSFFTIILLFLALNTQSMSNYSRYLTPKTVLFFGSAAGMGYLAWWAHKNAKYMDTTGYRNMTAMEQEDARPQLMSYWRRRANQNNVPVKMQKGFTPGEPQAEIYAQNQTEGAVQHTFSDPDKSIRFEKNTRNILGLMSLGLFVAGLYTIKNINKK